MTRREFIEDSAVGGLAFVTCAIQGGSGDVEAQPRRREVVVNGKRVKTVDVHAHCQVPEAMALMGLKITGQPNLPNVLLTPHVGGSVHGLLPRAYRLVDAQLRRYLAGKPLDNVVTDGY